MEHEPQPNPIAALNDAFRRAGPTHDWYLTQGAAALSDRIGLIRAVMTFNEFTEDNDPWGEHDCAVLTVDGRPIIFKHNYYDRDLQYHSPDAGDPAVTKRVLTIMLAEEY